MAELQQACSCPNYNIHTEVDLYTPEQGMETRTSYDQGKVQQCAKVLSHPFFSKFSFQGATPHCYLLKWSLAVVLQAF